MAQRTWFTMLASGHGTSMGCEDSLASAAMAEFNAPAMNAECTFHSGNALVRGQYLRPSIDYVS